VQTLDFITPVVDDPYLFGQIAAANSLSDVWAMGGKVITALNIVAYDNCNLSLDHLREILAGGADKVREAGGVIMGGHTIEDPEMKYGLCVTGTVHPQKYIRNNTTRPGDVIILTKPLGMGVITTAIKGEMTDKQTIRDVAFQMAFLNKYAAETAVRLNASALTDVTGFGLLGHLFEMTNSNTSIKLSFSNIPILEPAFELAEFGLFPAGAYRNKQHYSDQCDIYDDLDDTRKMLLYDPQTSGGLLISLSYDQADTALAVLKNQGMEWVKVIGEVVDKQDKSIIVRS
jgi:selenide,water dikinase